MKRCKIHDSMSSKICAKGGFTLVEVLVAIMILTIGILAVSQMTVMGTQVTWIVNQRMYARAVMSRYYEILNNLPNSDPLVRNWDNDNADLDDIGPTPDFQEYHSMGGVRYRVVWNAVNNVGSPPDDRIETMIRIHILWNNDRNRIHTDLIKGRKF
ncbi:MAG: type II secretion system protein [candidate division WOR-3 bacterium]